MGVVVFDYPAIQAHVEIDWNDVNLRLADVTWTIGAVCTVQIDIYRLNISPDPVTTRIITGPDSDSEPVPGNLRMEEYEDPEYPEEGVRILWPDGLVFNVAVL